MFSALQAKANSPFEDPIFLAVMLSILGLLVAAASVKGMLDQSKRWKLVRSLRRHFGVPLDTLTVVSREFLMFDLPNLRAAIDAYVAQQRGELEVLSVDGLDLTILANAKAVVSPSRFLDIDVDIDRQESFLTNGLYLLRIGERRLAVQLLNPGYYGNSWRTQSQLQVLASRKELAAECINALRRLFREVSIYRGKIISLEQNDAGHDEQGYSQIHFHEVPRVARDEIVLSGETMQIIERNTLRFFQKSALLRKAGQSIKRGLLFYGPPGTGKTWTARWLTHSLPNVTVILVTGEKLWNIKESCRLARMLAPSMVILEDVDLIALSRETTIHTTPLHELMNEMDGLDSDCEVLFLLTTNRPDALEPALAARPGRIDQAILFPLPDGECRRRLVELYGQGLDLQLEDVPRLVRRIDGASPAFIKELVRKAALIATDDHADGEPRLRVSDGHFDAALREMTCGDGELTGKLLGFNDLMT